VTDDDDREVTIGWLREPPGADEIRVLVECGDGVELSVEAQQALEQLMNELNDTEVQAYGMPGSFGPSFSIFAGSMSLAGTCQKLVCNQNDCERLSCDQYKSNRM
jgi:hypothetical protein